MWTYTNQLCLYTNNKLYGTEFLKNQQNLIASENMKYFEKNMSKNVLGL